MGTEVNERGVCWSLSLTQDLMDFLVFSGPHIPSIMCYEYEVRKITSTTLGSDEGEKTGRKVFHGK